MPTPNFFDATAGGFELVSWTGAISKFPNMYGRVRELNLFTPDPITTLTVIVEQRDGVLNLIHSAPRGGQPNLNISGPRAVRAFAVPHFPLDDVVLPGDVQNIRAFGTENVAETVAGVYARKLQEMRNKHAITLEWLRVKALQGTVLDSDASVLFNWFTEFGITQTTVNFALTTVTTEIQQRCAAVKRAIEAALKGEVMSGVLALCSAEFFDSLIAHAKVKEAYAGYQEAAVRLGGDQRKGFVFGGITFEDYGMASATDMNGTTRLFIPANEAIAFPIGTQETFRTVYAPANHMDAVNTSGKELYANAEPRRMGQGLDIHTEMNALPIVKRPEVLIKLTRS